MASSAIQQTMFNHFALTEQLSNNLRDCNHNNATPSSARWRMCTSDLLNRSPPRGFGPMLINTNSTQRLAKAIGIQTGTLLCLLTCAYACIHWGAPKTTTSQRDTCASASRVVATSSCKASMSTPMAGATAATATEVASNAWC